MNEYYSWWPVFIGTGWLFTFVGSKLFASLDRHAVAQPGHVHALDGLRGYSALAVLFYHAAIYHRFSQENVWAPPPGNAYVLMGTGGVAFFFMITGYLFWCRLIDEKGRPDWVRFYVGRLFRIAPLYYIAMLAMVALVLDQTGWHLNVPVSLFASQLAPWLALGVLDPTDINNHPATLLLTAGVTWSLRYEWIFYAVLPFVAVLAGTGLIRSSIVFLAVIAGLLWNLYGGPWLMAPGDSAYATMFCVGAACAVAEKAGWTLRLDNRVSSVAVAALLAVLLATCQLAFSSTAIVLLGACFFLIISGCTFFGLLTARPSRRLGDASYGIYLLQGLVLAALFQFPAVRHYASRSPTAHWSVILAGATLLVSSAAAAHLWVERPGIAAGRCVARRLSNHRARNIREAQELSP